MNVAVLTQTRTDAEELYRATTTPRLVVVPALRFLCIDGSGDPATNPDYAAAIQALYSVAYTAKYAVKAAGGPPVRLFPLEALWWSDDPDAFTSGRREDWHWTMMLRIPGEVSDDVIDHAAEEVATKRAMPAARRLRLAEVEEGPAAQVLHIGPYDTEGPTIARLHDFIRSRGFSLSAPDLRHHEIYLSDPRRCPIGRLRTIIRQPYVVGAEDHATIGEPPSDDSQDEEGN